MLSTFEQGGSFSYHTYCDTGPRVSGLIRSTAPFSRLLQESLGFSPFELVFGHAVRGPLKLLKEKWLRVSGEDDNMSASLRKGLHRLGT
jgi:hypothetical protein